MTIIDGSVSVSGVANLFGSGAINFNLSDQINGSSNFSATSSVIYIGSAFFHGTADVRDELNLDGSLTVTGQANLSSPTGSIVSSGAASFIGQGSLIFEEFEPIIGQAHLTAFVDVICAPVIYACVCEQPKSYRIGGFLDSRDLDISLSNHLGPFDPVCITYSLHQVVKGCVSKQMGLSRKPGKDAIGHYYVTGTVGDCGQPGLWLVRWRYQSTFGGPFYEKDCYFYLVDSVLCPVPGDTLIRVKKYGWD